MHYNLGPRAARPRDARAASWLKNAISRPVANCTGSCTFLSPGRSNCRSGCHWEYIFSWATLGAIHHSLSQRRAVYVSVGHCRLDWAEPGWSWVGLAGHFAYSCNSCNSCDWGGGPPTLGPDFRGWAEGRAMPLGWAWVTSRVNAGQQAVGAKIGETGKYVGLGGMRRRRRRQRENGSKCSAAGAARSKKTRIPPALLHSVLFCSVLFCSVLLCAALFYYVLLCSVLFCLGPGITWKVQGIWSNPPGNAEIWRRRRPRKNEFRRRRRRKNDMNGAEGAGIFLKNDIQNGQKSGFRPDQIGRGPGGAFTRPRYRAGPYSWGPNPRHITGAVAGAAFSGPYSWGPNPRHITA
eukprot:gene25841-biopygen4538